jgi:hypothetical protein
MTSEPQAVGDALVWESEAELDPLTYRGSHDG